MEAQGTGTRRYFDRATVVRAAVLVELRRLLGTRLRLGEIGRWVATLEPGLIDRRRDESPAWLVAYRDGGRLAEAYVGDDPQRLARLLRQRGAVVAVDLVAVNAKLWEALEG